jgi:hypothetical protein
MNVKKTITSIFMINPLGLKRDILKDNNFINAYSKDGHLESQYENSVYLLFKPSDIDKFRDFLDDEYSRTKLIVDDYDYENGFVVIVYCLEDLYKKDLDLIREGKYSKTSKEFQLLFPKFVKINIKGVCREELSLQYRIFNKTEDLRKYWENKLGVSFDESWEVWDTFIIDKETLFIDKIKENVQ